MKHAFGNVHDDLYTLVVNTMIFSVHWAFVRALSLLGMSEIIYRYKKRGRFCAPSPIVMLSKYSL